MIDKEKAIRWFENIAYECDKLTSGNVAHLRAQIKGMAIRSAEYLKKNEPASEDLEQAANKYGKEETILPEGYNDGDIPDYEKWTADAFKAGAHWQKEQMKKDAVEGYVARDKNLGLFLYKEKPVLNKRFGGFWQGERSLCIPRGLFPEQKWDDRPIEVKIIIIKE